MAADTERARSALYSIDAGCAHDEWVRAGMAAKSAGLSFEDFHNWSKPAANYKCEDDCSAAWKSFDESGPVKEGTLFHMARESGWSDTARTRKNGHDKRQSFAGATSTHRAQNDPQQASKQATDASVLDVWERCIPADAADAYVQKKRGTPDGLRIYPASAPPHVICGQNVAGYLAVPCSDGEHLRTIQFIPPNGGDKLNLAAAKFGNGYFTVGEITDRIFIVEGIGQAWAAWKVTGAAAVVTFGAGRMATVSKVLREKYPAAKLVLVPDRGKEEKAEAIARAVNAEWCELPKDKPENYDCNDFAQEFGADALADLLESAKAPSPEKTAPEIIVKCSPLDWAALATRGDPPARRWALYGWLGFFINLMVGSGGIGKTLLAQQMGSALALAGRSFIDTIDCALTILAWFCEDEHDEIWRRQVQIASFFGVGIEAFRDKFIIMPRHGMENALVTTEYGRPMFTPLIGELREQAADYRADVVILDNAAQLYGGGENDRHSVTFFMNGLAGALPGRAVLLLAHPARSTGSEFSGSGAWENVARNRLFLGSHLPDQQPDADEQPDDNVRYLARRKANYSAKDWRRFQYQNGVLVPDTVEPAGGIIGHLYDQAAERAILDGLKRLQEMGIHPSEGATTSRYLPRLLLEYKLAEGRSKAELAGAMRRLMVDGKLTKAVVGKYAGNRSPMYGLTATG